MEMGLENRILGGFFGVACGDALGATLEFTLKKEGKVLYGYHTEIIGGGKMRLQAGEVTDDTKMTIAVARGILDNRDEPIEYIGRHFVEWHKTNPPDEGITVGLAVENYLKCRDWKKASLKTSDQLDGKCAGNGTLMRCIPAALYYKDYDKMVEVTCNQSYMTHYDSSAAEACILYNTLAYKYLRGGEKLDVMREVLNGTQYEGIMKMQREELHPSGYVIDSMICALWCFLNNNNFEESVCEAVNLYGDPDTIGAITGGLAGVYYGYDAIPERWKSKIIIKDELYDLASKFSV